MSRAPDVLELNKAWQIAGKNVVLHIGAPPGRVRPALWMSMGDEAVILAQFHGDKHAVAAAGFIDSMMQLVNEAIDYHNTVNMFHAAPTIDAVYGIPLNETTDHEQRPETD